MPEEEIRWHYRFRNFSRAFGRLQHALQEGSEALNELEQEGVIQRFEYTFELAWKTLKDYLEYHGVVLDEVAPRTVIRNAYQAKLISDGERWIDMLTDRNRMSHVRQRYVRSDHQGDRRALSRPLSRVASPAEPGDR